VPPPIEVPLASRRLGEQGLVQLRVLVGVDGLPRQVSVQRSSGFARLDEQAPRR
jgi:protein TonB